jgi:hypothetical protein
VTAPPLENGQRASSSPQWTNTRRYRGVGLDLRGGDRGAAPRAALDLEHGEAVAEAVLVGLLELLVGLLEALGLTSVPTHRPMRNGSLPQVAGSSLAGQLGSAHEGRRPLELLRREQPERVAHEDGNAVAPVERPVGESMTPCRRRIAKVYAASPR